MRSNEANIFVFISSLIIGVLISTSISIPKKGENSSKSVFLSAQQYEDAYNYKNKLRSEILDYIREYNDFSTKLKKYTQDDTDQLQVKNNINEELEQDEMILGKKDVEGQGIAIDINDGVTNDSMSSFQYQMRIVHNTDIMQVINDLRNSGAEAISINGNRIIDRSEIYCSGPFLRVNGTKIAAPFIIYAIGNKGVLHSYMMSNENYLKIMMTRKIYVKLSEIDKVRISAYSGEYKTEFMNKD